MKLTVHCIQTDILWEHKAANFDKVTGLVEHCQPSPGGLIVLPEMFATGFSMSAAVTAETTDGETCGYLSRLAKTTQCAVLGGVVLQQSDGTATNSAVFFDPIGVLRTIYAKQRPFSLSHEEQFYSAGSETVVFEQAGFHIAPLICYDLRFPELARQAVSRGADLLVYIASWPIKRAQHWVTLLQARAIENQAYVIGVNRMGSDPDFTYPGRSLVVDPHGVIIADAADREQVVTTVVDSDVVSNWRAQFPALKDAGW